MIFVCDFYMCVNVSVCLHVYTSLAVCVYIVYISASIDVDIETNQCTCM